MSFVGDAGPGFAIDGLQPHLAAKALQPFAVDLDAVIALENRLQTPCPQTGVNEEKLIEQTLDTQIQGTFRHGLIARRGARNVEEMTLFSHAQLGMFFF